jgi:hypothetical protein
VTMNTTSFIVKDGDYKVQDGEEIEERCSRYRGWMSPLCRIRLEFLLGIYTGEIYIYH